MAKLIKRDQADGPAAPEGQQTLVSTAAPQRRGAIIDREAFEAKHEALSIRDRAEGQAAEVVAAAHKEAERLLAEARGQAEVMGREAHEEGLRAGRQEGATEYVALCAQVREEIERSQDALAPQVTQLAMMVARRVLGRELQFAPEAVVDMVKKTLGEKARQRREVTLRVHPDDAVHLREHKASLAEVLSRSKDIRIVEDEQVPPHGVIIETEAGTIDAKLETQLMALERALQAVA